MGIAIFITILFAILILLYIWWYNRYGMPTKPPIILYHKITDNFQFEGTWVKVGQFERQIKYLHEHGYKTIKSLDIDETNGKGIIITFDDGFEDVYKNAFPIMEKYGFKGIVFIIAGFIGNTAKWDLPGKGKYPLLSSCQIKELYSNGWEIGVHSYSHRDLTKLSEKELRKEVIESKKIIEDMLGEEVYLFSYPYGKYNDLVYNMVKEHYKMAFASCPPIKNSIRDRYAIYRRGIYITDSMFAFKEKINPTSVIRYGFEDMAIRSINRVSHLTPLIQRRRYK